MNDSSNKLLEAVRSLAAQRRSEESDKIAGQMQYARQRAAQDLDAWLVALRNQMTDYPESSKWVRIDNAVAQFRSPYKPNIRADILELEEVAQEAYAEELKRLAGAGFISFQLFAPGDWTSSASRSISFGCA